MRSARQECHSLEGVEKQLLLPSAVDSEGSWLANRPTAAEKDPSLPYLSDLLDAAP